jgi:hypothetical protein
MSLKIPYQTFQCPEDFVFNLLKNFFHFHSPSSGENEKPLSVEENFCLLTGLPDALEIFCWCSTYIGEWYRARGPSLF